MRGASAREALNEQFELRNARAGGVDLGLTWTAQLRKQLFWPGPLSRPLVSLVSWCGAEDDAAAKKFIGKCRVMGEPLVALRCAWNAEPTVIWSPSRLNYHVVSAACSEFSGFGCRQHLERRSMWVSVAS